MLQESLETLDQAIVCSSGKSYGFLQIQCICFIGADMHQVSKFRNDIEHHCQIPLTVLTATAQPVNPPPQLYPLLSTYQQGVTVTSQERHCDKSSSI